MKTGFFDNDDIQLLRDVEYILRSGRVGDLVHDSYPSRVGALADRLDPQRKVRTRFGPVEGR